MRRYAFSVPLAVLATAGFLLLMASLVSGPTPPVHDVVRAHFVDRVDAKPVAPVEPRSICKCAPPKALPPFQVVRRAPIYPASALRRGIDGWVRIRFSISPAGTVRDPRIVESQPVGVFDRAALRAVLRWRYVSLDERGERIWGEDQLVLRFRAPRREASL